MKNFMRNTGLALLSAMMLSSCFDLKEEVYSEIPMDNFGKTEQELIATAGRAYTQLQNYCTEQSLWTLSLQVADECAVPINSNGSWAEERYGELQRQQYTPSNTLVLKGWNFCFDGIASCNEILYELGLSTVEFEAKEKITAEVEVLRAFFYFMAIDGWGNVPYSIDYTDTSYPEQKDRKFLFSFIEKSIKDNLPLLDAEPSTSTYGRVTQDVAYTLLAKLYLNAEEWLGTPMWAEAEAACYNVISKGHYSIADDYASNFSANNEGSVENIFVIPYSTTYTESDHNSFIIYIMALDSWATEKFNIPASAWDGFVCQPDFFQKYDAADKRRDATWLYKGNQTNSGGYDVTDAPYNPVFDESLYSTRRALYDGARIWKWHYQTDGQLISDQTSMDNDFVLFRYADVVLMYAEALVRQNRAAEAAQLADLQKIRTRAGLPVYSAADLTLDELLDERGRELAWEGWRRQDLIRFGKYNDTWWAKPTASPATKRLFPIPTTVLAANPRLSQNPGY